MSRESKIMYPSVYGAYHIGPDTTVDLSMWDLAIPEMEVAASCL